MKEAKYNAYNAFSARVSMPGRKDRPFFPNIKRCMDTGCDKCPAQWLCPRQMQDFINGKNKAKCLKCQAVYNFGRKAKCPICGSAKHCES